jgi:hypothetical protein
MLGDKLKGFMKLPHPRKIFLIKSMVLIILTRSMLRLFSFSRVRKISARMSSPGEDADLEDLVWSVRTASHLLGSSCLANAISGQILLSRHNHPSKLRIGVFKDDKFEAHAWLEVEGQVVLGETEREYTPIYDVKWIL